MPSTNNNQSSNILTNSLHLNENQAPQETEPPKDEFIGITIGPCCTIA